MVSTFVPGHPNGRPSIRYQGRHSRCGPRRRRPLAWVQTAVGGFEMHCASNVLHFDAAVVGMGFDVGLLWDEHFVGDRPVMVVRSMPAGPLTSNGAGASAGETDLGRECARLGIAGRVSIVLIARYLALHVQPFTVTPPLTPASILTAPRPEARVCSCIEQKCVRRSPEWPPSLQLRVFSVLLRICAEAASANNPSSGQSNANLSRFMFSPRNIDWTNENGFGAVIRGVARSSDRPSPPGAPAAGSRWRL